MAKYSNMTYEYDRAHVYAFLCALFKNYFMFISHIYLSVNAMIYLCYILDK